MEKKDIIPACLQSIQDDSQYRATFKAAMPVETHPAFESVERDRMFLPNGMLTLAAHAFIKELNAALPVVEATLAMHGDDRITVRASKYRSGVEARKSAHGKARQVTAPGLLKRASSLAKAIGSETKAVVQGQPNLTADQLAARLAVCGSCDQLRSNRTCIKCGCFVDAKARFRSQSCPLRKWPALCSG
jgi:hypothetical protein